MRAILTGPDGEENPNLNLEKTSKQNFEPPHSPSPGDPTAYKADPNTKCSLGNTLMPTAMQETASY
jgi:hypothetical protein